NEEENVAECYREVKEVLEHLGRPYEIVFIDDGSYDSTVENLLNAAQADSRLKVIEFRRNFGQTAALAAGFANTSYPIIVTMDGDLQNDPKDIIKMIRILEEGGYDLVTGWRKNRKDNLLLRKIPSKIANKLISWATGVELHDYGCTLKVFRAEVAKCIGLYGEMHRFIPALAAEVGAKIIEVPVNHRARKYGKSKYGISRTIRVILDLLTVKFLLGYSKRPIHLFGTFGILSFLLGFLGIIYLTVEKFIFHIPMGNRPALILSAILILVGIQFLVFGLLAEMLARTYYESQGKAVYSVRQVHTFDKNGKRISQAVHPTARIAAA
ncbi:MAG: glycosyltransferase, partial [Candidatus Dadabacteria bacterium]